MSLFASNARSEQVERMELGGWAADASTVPGRGRTALALVAYVALQGGILVFGSVAVGLGWG